MLELGLMPVVTTMVRPVRPNPDTRVSNGCAEV